MSAAAMSALIRYQWPGNVRELEHAVQRAVILADRPTIRPRDLPPEITGEVGQGDMVRDTLDLRAQERASIERALARYEGNRKRAAAALNISTVTLWRRRRQYGLTR